EHRCRDEIGTKCLTFVTIKARRHKLINLHGHHRKRQKRRAKHGQFDLGDEIFEQRCVDKFGVRGPGDPNERPNQNIIDLLGEKKASDEHHQKSRKRLDQAAPQLNEMLHQGRFGRLDVLLAHGKRPSALSWETPRSSPASWTRLSACSTGDSAAGLAMEGGGDVSTAGGSVSTFGLGLSAIAPSIS